MSKIDSILLIVVVVIIILFGLWLLINYIFLKMFKSYSVKRWRRFTALVLVVVFVLFLSYLYYWLVNYGC